MTRWQQNFLHRQTISTWHTRGGPVEQKAEFLDCCKRLDKAGYSLYASPGTAAFLQNYEIPVTLLHWPLDSNKPNILDFISEGRIDLVINIPKNYETRELTNGYLIRRKAIDFSVPLITNINCAKLFVEALFEKADAAPKSWLFFAVFLLEKV